MLTELREFVFFDAKLLQHWAVGDGIENDMVIWSAETESQYEKEAGCM